MYDNPDHGKNCSFNRIEGFYARINDFFALKSKVTSNNLYFCTQTGCHVRKLLAHLLFEQNSYKQETAYYFSSKLKRPTQDTDALLISFVYKTEPSQVKL